MSKTPSINKSHIHNLYVHRNTVVSGTSTVDGVTPVRKVENNTFYSDGNYLYYSDAFYDHLSRFERAYSQYYTQNNRLSKLSKKLSKENNNKNITLENLIRLLRLLTSEYNQTILSLKAVEEESNIRLSLAVKEALLEQQYFLGYLGVTLNKDFTCGFAPWILQSNYHYNSEKVMFLVRNKSTLLQTLANLFKKVTVERENSSGYQSMDHEQEQGVLLDKRT